MLNTPLITVLIPVYNVAPYIQVCLDSIFNQTFQDFEILVVDDCSTDNTVQVIESLASERITIVKKKENKGLIDSLNVGFSLARGKYIARVDGDDFNTLDRFEKQYYFLENHPSIAACGCWLQAFGFSNRVIKHPETNQQIKAHMLLSNSMSLGATMLRREFYLDEMFDESKIHAEDYDFWVRTIDKAPLYNLQEVLYYYRTHETQVSTTFKHIQLEKDVEIKLNLWKKINYDSKLFSDDFVIKMIISKESFNLKDFKKIKIWFKNVIKSNFKTKVFERKELNIIIIVLQRELLDQIFFIGKRIKTSKVERLMLLFTLPLQDIMYFFKRRLKWN